jgi:hypothetical protein
MTADERVKGFMEAYSKIREEFQVDFGYAPMYMGDGQGGFKTVVNVGPIDLTQTPQPSPFMATE